jgi:type I restriction enzyme S subunit
MSSTVPDGWSEDYISEYFDFSIGGTPSRNNELYWDANQTTSNIWVSIRDLKDKFISNSAERISELGVSKSNVKLLPKGTVLMSFKLSIGRLSISMTPLYTNEAIVGFIEKRPNTVDRDYLYYGLQSWNLLGEVVQAVKGATLNKDKMSRILGIFPPLPEQKKIASILTSVDEVIENTQKQIDKLQDLKKATMNELLTNGIGHTEFKDSELGRIPKSWEVKTIGELGSLKNGLNKPKESFGYGTKFVNISDAYPVQLNCDSLGRLDASTKEIKDYSLEGGDLVFVRSSVKLGGVAIPTEFCYCGEPVVFCGFMIRFRPNLKGLESSFLRQYLLNDTTRVRVERLAAGGANININQEALSQFKVLLPTTEEQKYFSSVNVGFEDSLQKYQEKLSQTQSLKKSLMQDLLTGKVRVVVN